MRDYSFTLVVILIVAAGPAGCGGSSRAAQSTTASSSSGAPSTGTRRPSTGYVPPASDLVKRGEELLASGDIVGAKQLFDAAIQENPKDARAHFDRGVASEMLREPTEAEMSYQTAATLEPNFSMALNNWGLMLRSRGLHDDAIHRFQAASTANPDFVDVYWNIALTMEDKGRYADAAKNYRKAIELDPSAPLPHINLGFLLLDMGDKPNALREFHAAKPLSRGNRTALAATGSGLRRAGNAELAVIAMREAIAAGDGKPTAALQSELALALWSSAKRDEAVQTVQQAIELNGEYSNAYYILGTMYAAMGRDQEAINQLERYLKLDPKGPWAKNARKGLHELRARRARTPH
jgi:tetratricopeptide (TPR) repeat protein